MLLQALFPWQCVACTTYGSVWCRTCQQHVVDVHRQHTRETHAPILGFQQRVCVARYANKPLQDGIRALKFHGIRQSAKFLGGRMAYAYKQTALKAADTHLLLPLPLSRRRRYQRGYNQAELLARALHASVLRQPIASSDTPFIQRKNHVDREGPNRKPPLAQFTQADSRPPHSHPSSESADIKSAISPSASGHSINPFNIHLNTTWLRRAHRKAQTSVPTQKRHTNIQNAYHARIPPRDVQSLLKHHLLARSEPSEPRPTLAITLIDDVITSGASMTDAKRALTDQLRTWVLTQTREHTWEDLQQQIVWITCTAACRSPITITSHSDNTEHTMAAHRSTTS